MGKRKKSSRGPVKKIKQKLDVTFACLFCNHENSVTANLDKQMGIGTLTCKVCGQNFQASINVALSEPIDVYCEWVDACEAVAKKGQSGDEEGEGEGHDSDGYGETSSRPSGRAGSRPSALSDEEDDEEDLF
ncbi:uncharacterized protein SAPINGB_P002934 [Magnusiomyces paraingens]|uniref:Transcription elongation factor 1 homolog n=1 Tax=Magnusiomyces paraingens TaxID=2606893 RepID=A0A5E8BHC0_9ASCO|nr:uncharacterized protein SAPINGB_P002934 [Saprochaete ingens]VVT50950.1 unnamed protein product [Saprochaete ingens]